MMEALPYVTGSMVISSGRASEKGQPHSGGRSLDSELQQRTGISFPLLAYHPARDDEAADYLSSFRKMH